MTELERTIADYEDDHGVDAAREYARTLVEVEVEVVTTRTPGAEALNLVASHDVR